MIGELLQLSRENEELRKEISALKAELAQEREKSEGLRGAFQQIADNCPIIRDAEKTDDSDVLWESTKRRRIIARQALLANRADVPVEKLS